MRVWRFVRPDEFEADAKHDEYCLGELVMCKDCRKHNKEVCIDVPYKEDACPLISWRGKAQGHEFDYQYCPYGERKK